MSRTRLLIAVAVGCLVSALALHGSATDRAWFLQANEAAWRWLPPAVPSCITLLGHGLAAVMLLSPALLRAPGVLAAGLYSAPMALLLSRAPKALIDSPRPAAVLDAASFHVNGMRLASHNSFPSGHAITAFLLVGVLLAGRPDFRLRWPAALAAMLAGAAVALSRLAVGAHWPSDVLAGAGLGLLAGLAGTRASMSWPLPAGRLARAALVALLLGCAAALAVADTGYPEAQPLQWLLAALGAGVGLLALRGPAAAPAAPPE
jgi:membrane-associated phospholipid phosphatase